MQYIAKSWRFFRAPWMDTMIAHAVCFPGLQKSLDFLASLYLPFHQYWKDENKEANLTLNDRQRWEYNCKDCVITRELVEHIIATVEDLNLSTPLQMEMDLFDPLMYMMMRGTKFNKKLRDEYSGSIMAQRYEIEVYLDFFSELWDDFELVKSKKAAPWYASPTQQKKIFYDLFGLPEIRTRDKTHRVTVDDEALKKIGYREPLFYPIVRHLEAYRSLGVFLSTFVLVRLDKDGRIRCSFNPVGTETFRFSSSADAFGFGTNLQNIPAGNEDN